LKKLELVFDADPGMLRGKNTSGVLRALDQVLLKGFQITELSLSHFKLICGKNIENINISEGFGVTRPICLLILSYICNYFYNM